MKILAIETSCDETAAAVVEDGTKILSNVIASSAAMHRKYGGIVPEVAAREQLACIIPTIKEALHQAQITIDELDAIAVTVGPGLIGSLLIGVESAKTIAFVKNKPLIPVNHVLAHIYANFVHSEPFTVNRKQINFPAISLVASGGHTELFLMESPEKLTWLGGTLDDAAGEAFDKTARLLGFGTGGGPAIEKAAKEYQLSAFSPSIGLRVNPQQPAIKLPRPMMHDESLNFSFSGLKTAVLREYNKLKVIHSNDMYYHSENLNTPLSDDITSELAFEIQEAITDVLVAKTMSAVKKHQAKSILLSGGVAANSRLRDKFQLAIDNSKLAISLHVPPIPLCTDNAVYIASYAYFRGNPTDWHKVTALPDLSVEE